VGVGGWGVGGGGGGGAVQKHVECHSTILLQLHFITETGLKCSHDLKVSHLLILYTVWT